MLRIGIDARYLSSRYSGIGVYSANLLRALDRLGSPYQYVVFAHESFQRKLDLGENFEIVKLGCRPLSAGTFFGETRRAYEDAKLDVLHAHFPLLPVGWRGQTLLTLHDLQPFTVPDFTAKRLYPVKKAYDLFYRWAYPSAFAKSQVIACVSRATQDQLYALFPETARRSLAIHSGLDETYFAAEPPEEELDNTRLKYRLPENYVLYIGSTRPNKNLPNMLRGFAQYVRQTGDKKTAFALVVAKDRFWRESEKLIDSLGLKGRALAFDQIKHKEKRAFYLMAKALFFATKSEGFGFPALEAQASGCPVLAADEDALPEVAGEAALYADPDDPEDLARGLDLVLNDEEIRETLIALGYKNCRRFSWDKCAKRVHSVYKHFYDPDSFLPRDQLEPAAALASAAAPVPAKRLLGSV